MKANKGHQVHAHSPRSCATLPLWAFVGPERAERVAAGRRRAVMGAPTVERKSRSFRLRLGLTWRIELWEGYAAAVASTFAVLGFRTLGLPAGLAAFFAGLAAT
jgi:hypothetical protein